MRTILAIVLFATLPALAQAPAAESVKKGSCAECGVVRSVRQITKETRPPESQDNKPSGLVATIPLGGGGKAQVGSSTKLGKEAQSSTTTWEVIVRLDDGRFRVFVLDEAPEVQQDDKVRIEEGRVVPR
jgi:hypothetical protein